MVRKPQTNRVLRRREMDFAPMQCFSREIPKDLRLEQGLCITNGNAKVGTTKTPDDGEGYANHVAVAIDQWTTGPAGSSLGIVNDFVRQDIADMSLGHERPDQLALLEFVNDFLRVATGDSYNVFHGVFTGTRQDGADSCCVAQ